MHCGECRKSFRVKYYRFILIIYDVVKLTNIIQEPKSVYSPFTPFDIVGIFRMFVSGCVTIGYFDYAVTGSGRPAKRSILALMSLASTNFRFSLKAVCQTLIA